MFARLAGPERYRHPNYFELSGAPVTEGAHWWHIMESCREEKKAQWGELEESILLLNFIHFLVLVIYIFVTIQLFNVCLVLFLTLLYIRTQR